MGTLQVYIVITHLANAGPYQDPTSTGLGLERFGALRHLDMQSVCGEAPLHFYLETQADKLIDKLHHLALQPAAVRQLAALSGTLQTLCLMYHEDLPDHMVRSCHAFVTRLLLADQRGLGPT